MSGGAGDFVPTGVRAVNRPEIRQGWRGASLVVLDNHGCIGEHPPLSGFFFRETRYLSRLRLQIDGEEPVCASAAEGAQNELEFTYIYPPVETRGGGGSGSGGDHERHGILSRGLDLDLRFHVRPASVEVALNVTSRWNEQVEFDLSWELGADYAGVFEAMGEERQQEAPVEAEFADGLVRFRYGHEELRLETRVRAAGAAWEWNGTSLSTTLRLARQETATFRLRIEAVDGEAPLSPEAEEAREALLQAYLERLPRLYAPAETPLVALTTLALHDLGTAALLDGPEDEWLTPAAGYPLYPGAFGRDAATASWQTAAFDHGELARGTAATLARLQGTRREDRRDELPGRIIQQARRDPLSRLDRVPFGRYYGDVASPFMYIIALGNAYAWSGDRSLVERHWDPMRRVLDWARTEGDLDGDGYIEYRTRSEDGPKHQGWKDSDNAVVDERGEQVDAPFAPCEIQGYWLGALQFMAAFAVVMDRKADAVALWGEATGLKERFNRDFWLHDEGYVAFGLGPDKQPVRVLASNAAQCIATGIVADEHVPRLVRRIFEPDLFSGWGIRTLSTANPAFNPLSYHLGTVWPVENGSILFGLRRYGFDERATELGRALYDLALLWPGGRVPECVGGYARAGRSHPGAYPRANSFQTWNQSVFPILLQSLLGARAVGALNLLALDPVLPPWLPEITVKRWRVGEATVSLRFWRDGDGKSQYEILEQEGALRIVRQAPVDSLGVGMLDRLGDLIRDVLPF